VNIFDELGMDWEAIVNARDTGYEADFMQETVAKKGPVLDLCCGTGRHVVALAKRGCNVTGMDVSKKLLAIAKLRMTRNKTRSPLIRADMRFFPFRDNIFEAILNMFTSFGYLPSESEDALSLLEINRTLKGKGKFLLDLANRDHIFKGFRERDWAEFTPFYLLEKRSLDFKASKLSSQWTLIEKKAGHIKSIQHNVRLYTYTRVEQLLNEAGLAIEHVYGGYNKQEFTLETSRMIIIAQKSA
jgi:SAM-dependent methyltransferase